MELRPQPREGIIEQDSGMVFARMGETVRFEIRDSATLDGLSIAFVCLNDPTAPRFGIQSGFAQGNWVIRFSNPAIGNASGTTNPLVVESELVAVEFLFHVIPLQKDGHYRLSYQLTARNLVTAP